MKDIIIDFETLGNASETDNFIVLNMSCLLFDIDEKDEFEHLLANVQSFKFDIDEQIDIGWKAEKDTLEWWKKQSKEARKQLEKSDEDIKIKQFVDDFSTILNEAKIERIWSRGTDFDLPILKRLFRQDNKQLNSYLPYWAATDIRTYLKALSDFKLKDL